MREMAESGLSFKLDWNSTNNDVAVIGTPVPTVNGGVIESDGSVDGGIAEHSEGGQDEGGEGVLPEDQARFSQVSGHGRNENLRPMRSPQSLREKLLRKLLKSKVQTLARAA